MKYQKALSVVLRRVNYAEADRIITFLTDSNEQVALIAKGSRKAGSKMASSIELFTISEITFVKGKADLGTLTSIRLIKNYQNIISKLERIESASRLIKLIDKVSIHQTHQENWFSILRRAYELYDIQNLSTLRIELLTKASILSALGLMPNIQSIPNNFQDQSFDFDFDKKLFVHSDNGGYTINHLKILKVIQDKQINVLFRLKIDDEMLTKLLNIIDKILLFDL